MYCRARGVGKRSPEPPDHQRVQRARTLRALAGGDVIELVGATADVTEQHWARAAFEMKRLEDQFRMMIDAIPTLAWCCLADGTTEFLNQRWLDYTGLSLEESLGWDRIGPGGCDACGPGCGALPERL